MIVAVGLDMNQKEAANMPRLLLLLAMVMAGGCEFIAPNTSKALSETKQVEYQKRQAEALERIAAALETRP